MGWQVTVGDLTWDEEQVTTAEAVAVTAKTGGGWDTLHPLHSPASTAAVVHTLLVVRGGHDAEAAWMIVNAMPAAVLLACVTKG